MLVDSHCHLDRLDLAEFDNDVGQVIAAAKEQDIGHILCVCINLTDFPAVLEIVERYPNVSASVGVHPNERGCQEPDVTSLLEHAKHPEIVAIGETGLDYFRSEGDLDWQRDRFCTHIQVAKACQKPLIIHTRQARDDTIDIMRTEGADQVGGVMHCFTESWEMAQQALELGFYISFSGIVTFASAKELKEVAKKVPLERILVETDAPYLAPSPHRGKQNQPAYTRLVAEYIAELRGMDYQELASATTANFSRLFKVAFASEALFISH